MNTEASHNIDHSVIAGPYWGEIEVAERTGSDTRYGYSISKGGHVIFRAHGLAAIDFAVAAMLDTIELLARSYREAA